jgi:hypothetical protein
MLLWLRGKSLLADEACSGICHKVGRGSHNNRKNIYLKSCQEINPLCANSASPEKFEYSHNSVISIFKLKYYDVCLILT